MEPQQRSAGQPAPRISRPAVFRSCLYLRATAAARLRLSHSNAWERSMAKKRKSHGSTARRTKAKRGGRRWSARVTRESDALDLKKGVFAKKDPKAIARSLKRSAERSSRRKSNSYRSALSMLTFYINRAGRHLSRTQRAKLEK